ncbi:retinaldehyde-binding protein 1 [Battus philenor]|uniref:retinaldehyde-binding protein 1 n=1 Tax=Battus philenor TaxID=42288 RepID=UPI0035CFA79C
MTTASVLLTVGTTWSTTSDTCEKDERVGRTPWNTSAVAARELRETPSGREQALRIMREWIQQNTDIKNVRQDDIFLLRFLRHKKYSIPMAQQTLLKYLSLRKYYPESFSNLDCEDPKIADILNSGYIVVSPVRDSNGRRVIVYNMSKFNANKYTCWDMCRVHVVVYESLLEDPTDQILGFIHVGDGSGVTASHITAWNPTDFARIIKWGEQSLPMRHKELHLVNIPSTIKYIIDFAVSKVTPKMAQRLDIHANLKQLHKNLDASCLPTIYGGPLQLQEMISHTKQLLSEQKKKLLALDDMEILSTRGIISSRNSPTITNGTVSVEGSFRKLDID